MEASSSLSLTISICPKVGFCVLMWWSGWENFGAQQGGGMDLGRKDVHALEGARLSMDRDVG
jgi:hypothetical protein